MKNLYFIQPNSMLSNAVYFPYSVASIAAYSFQFDDIKNNYNLCEFIFIKENIDKVIEQINNPYIAAFSCYMWNIEYNLSLAKAIKNKWPKCILIFGGPQIPETVDFLEKHSFIDITIHGEGEVAFYKILKNLLSNNDLSSVSNISYRSNSDVLKTKKESPSSLENFPSPYVMGLFDNLLTDEKYKDYSFDAILETNRGCPYKCIYCYWARNGTSFREFPISRIKEDIKWMATHGIGYCVCADSNFGILERDEDIADYVIEMKKTYGFPEKFETASAKNKDDFTFKINNKLEEYNLNRGISVAVQSMSPTTLEIIGRKNMSASKLSDQLKKYRLHNIDTYTDLILGLPGETLDSFCKGVCEVIEAGQHYSISIHRLEIFPNTDLYSDEIQNKYKIKTIKSQLCQHHSKIENHDINMSSSSEIVVSTSTMSQEDWKTAFETSTCIQSFHCLGLLRFIAVYLRKAHNISYYDFYKNLFEWIKNESTTIKNIIDITFVTVDSFLNEESNLFFADSKFGNIYWAFDEGLFLNCVYRADDFYEEIDKYLRRYFEDSELLYDLLHYQQKIITLPNKQSESIITAYDWYDYFDHIFDDLFIHPKKNTTKLITAKSTTENWIDYACEIVWYGRRSGKTINKITECIR